MYLTVTGGMNDSFETSEVCDSSLYSASEQQKLVNSTDMNKTKGNE